MPDIFKELGIDEVKSENKSYVYILEIKDIPSLFFSSKKKTMDFIVGFVNDKIKDIPYTIIVDRFDENSEIVYINELERELNLITLKIIKKTVL